MLEKPKLLKVKVRGQIFDFDKIISRPYFHGAGIPLLPPRHSGRFPAAGFAFGGRGFLHAGPGLIERPVPRVTDLEGRKPTPSSRSSGGLTLRIADRQSCALPLQLPPRITR